MPTTIPRVRVAPIEASAGFHITCTHCSLWLIRCTRTAADLAATDHQNTCKGARP